MDVSSAQVKRDPNVKQSSGPRGAPQGSFSELEEEMCDENKVLERHMHKELSQARKEGGDVDRLVMKALLARVRDAGPKSAYKALASIEVRNVSYFHCLRVHTCGGVQSKRLPVIYGCCDYRSTLISVTLVLVIRYCSCREYHADHIVQNFVMFIMHG